MDAHLAHMDHKLQKGLGYLFRFLRCYNYWRPPQGQNRLTVESTAIPSRIDLIDFCNKNNGPQFSDGVHPRANNEYL